MRSPADMEFIQIDITNACNMRCSNCTRFCGNHKKAFFMDFSTFKRAVDSMDGFDGVTGMIGGEPTLHPEFERFAGYMREKFGKPARTEALLYPQKDFIHNIHQREFDSEAVRERQDGSRFMKKYGAGLWSNMGKSYRKYYEVIQDTFSVEYLNDHINPSYHQPGLFARTDLNIPDDEWVKLRDTCWIQNTWSATITPKGAFFCEIAGALDMLFDGPGGWPIEPGWWKRTPEDFADQLHWCELCGFALEGRTFTRNSQEETDDVSPKIFEMLQSTGSPKLKAGKINLVKIREGAVDEESKPEDKRFVVGDRYIARYEDRFYEKNSILFQTDYREVVLGDGNGFGINLNREIHQLKDMGWLLLKKAADIGAQDLKGLIGNRIFNPGSIHIGEGYVFFCKNARSLREIGFDRIARMSSIEEVLRAWQPEKVILLADTDEKTGLKRKSIRADKRYAIWGAGMLGELFAELVGLCGGEVSIVIDKSQEKVGKPFAGVSICAPEKLAERPEDYDYLMIAHHLYFEAIEKEALEMGIPREKMILPYDV